MEASWSVLEPLGGVLKRLGALLQAIWPDAENVEKPLVFLAFWGPGRSWKRLGGLLERLGGILETSWSRLGAAAAFDAGFDAAAAGSKLSWWLEASCSRLGGVLDPLEGLLEPQKTS